MIDNINSLKKHLELKEGRRCVAYKDSEGYWTIGVGHLLDAEQKDDELEAMGLEDELENWEGFQISERAVDSLLDIDIEDTLHGLRFSFTDAELEGLDPQRFCALFNMAFQNGSCIKFPSMVKAVKEGDWNRAADEMLWSNGLRKKKRSVWYTQTPGRCQENADMMRFGSTRNEPDDVPDLTEGADVQARSTERLLQDLDEITAELGRRIRENDL